MNVLEDLVEEGLIAKAVGEICTCACAVALVNLCVERIAISKGSHPATWNAL